MMTLINTTMLSNESTRSGFEQLLMLSNPPLDNYDDTLDAARSMLRTRQNYVEMDAVKANSSQFGGLPALTAAHVAALASVSQHRCLTPSRFRRSHDGRRHHRAERCPRSRAEPLRHLQFDFVFHR